MPTQVVNSELVDLLRPFFRAKSEPTWKLVPLDGSPDPSFWVDSSGNATAEQWLYAMPGISTEWIDGNGTAMSVNECYSVSYDCVSTGTHAHVGFSIYDRLFFHSDKAVNSGGWTTLDSIGDRQTGIYIVNGVSDNDTADSRFQALVYYSECGGGITSAIEYKVGAANAQLQIAGADLQCQALNVNLNRVSVIGLESFHL